MRREPAGGPSRRAVGDIAALAAGLGEDLLTAVPVVGDRSTQRAVDDVVDALVDALRMLGAQAGYVRAAWPEAGSARVGPERALSDRVWESR